MLGKIYGKWRVAEIRYAFPYPWAWIVRVDDPMVQARMPLDALDQLK